jgi:long-chain acyl-CoA synthetase
VSSPYSSDSVPFLPEPEIRRLDGVVREAAVPPIVGQVTHGSLADIPFDNAAAAPLEPVLSRKTPDGEGWTDVTAAEFAEQVLAVAKGLIAEGLVPGDRIAIMARTRSPPSSTPRAPPAAPRAAS